MAELATTTAPSRAPKPTPLKTDIAVDIIGMHKWYGDFHVLKDINLKVMRGERIVICGPSGSGKSTPLRCVNGLNKATRGEGRAPRSSTRS